MARPKAFDTDKALDAAVAVFRDHGYEGSSASMLVGAMGIGRQSLYDSFGDKWQLYRAALRRYTTTEIQAHLHTLRNEDRAIDGLRAMMDRVVAEAENPCLGVGSICEFGTSRADLEEIKSAAASILYGAIADRIREAQEQGDLAADLDPTAVAGFFDSSFAGIRIAARGGANHKQLQLLGELAFRALR